MAIDHMGTKTSKVAHVGVERFDKLTQIGIDLSSQCRKQITGSAFLKFMIDNYSEQATTLFLSQSGRDIDTTEG